MKILAAACLMAAPLCAQWGGLGSLPLIGRERTRSISPENPTGAKGRGGMAVPNPDDPNLPFSKAAVDLGQGWKVNPFIKPKAARPSPSWTRRGPASSGISGWPARPTMRATGAPASCASTGTARPPRPSKCRSPISSPWATRSSRPSIRWRWSPTPARLSTVTGPCPSAGMPA